jgi:DnaA family protein
MIDSRRQLALQILLDDSATFDNFFVVDSNKQLVDYLLAEASGRLDQFVYLWGTSGSGCSHLLQSVCHNFDARSASSFYLPLRQFQDYSPEIFDGLESFELVCLDDLEAIAGQRDWELGLFSLFNRLRESGTRLLVGARCGPRELQITLPDLLSRLQSGIVFQVQALDDEEKREALRLRATRRGIELNDEVISYVLQRNERSMQALFALLERLDRFSLQSQRRITVPMVRELLDSKDTH